MRLGLGLGLRGTPKPSTMLAVYSALPVGTPLAAGSLPGGGAYTQAAGSNQTEETVQTSASTVLRWAFAANLPRIGLLADGGTGLVLEPPRTNAQVKSVDLSDATKWVVSGATVSADAGVAPDGATTADRLTSTTSAAAAFVFNNTGTGLDSTNSVASYWLKAGSQGSLGSQQWGASGQRQAANPTATWTRWALAAAVGATPFVAHYLNANGAAGVSVSGDNALLWGMQVELGKYPTNAIPTTTVAASRAGFRVTFPISRYVRGGALRMVQTVVPHGAATDYDGDSATVRLWTIDANTYAEFATATRLLTVVVNGVSRAALVPLWWLKGHRVQWSWEVGNGNLRVRYRYSTDQGATWTLPFDPFGGTVYTDSTISTASSTIDLYSDSGSSKWFGTGSVSEEAILTAPAWALQALPTDVASVKAFFRADSSYTLSAGTVSAWSGQTATAVTAFTQGTGANQPALTAAAFGSARPGITTDGTNDYMTGADITSVWTAAAKTIYALVRVNAVSLDNATIYTNHGIVQDSGSYSGLVARANTPRLGSWNYDGAYKEAYSAGGFSVGASCVVRVRHGSGTVGIRVGNGAEVTIAAGASTWGAGPYLLRMGTQYNAAAGFTAADFGALVFGNAEPSVAEDAAIMSFLNAYGGL